MLLSPIDSADFNDRLYEFAQDLCDKTIKEIESRYEIVDDNGEPFSNEDEEMWYDEFREEFKSSVLNKVRVKEQAQHVAHCPYCGSENISWMGDAHGDYEDGTEKMYCHDCDSWFGVK